MSAPVDVLAVMDNFIDPVNFPHQPHDLTEARAAVAELIEAVGQMLANAEFADGQGVVLTHDAESVEAALARCEGDAA